MLGTARLPYEEHEAQSRPLLLSAELRQAYLFVLSDAHQRWLQLSMCQSRTPYDTLSVQSSVLVGNSSSTPNLSRTKMNGRPPTQVWQSEGSLPVPAVTADSVHN